MSNNLLLTPHMEEGDYRVKLGAALDVCVVMIYTAVVYESNREKAQYLPMTGGRHFPTGRIFPAQSGQNDFEPQQKWSPVLFVLAAESGRLSPIVGLRHKSMNTIRHVTRRTCWAALIRRSCNFAFFWFFRTWGAVIWSMHLTWASKSTVLHISFSCKPWYSAVQTYSRTCDFSYMCDGISISDTFKDVREVDTPIQYSHRILVQMKHLFYRNIKNIKKRVIKTIRTKAVLYLQYSFLYPVL